MQFSVALLAAASLAAAQLGSPPSCATKCIQQFTSSAGDVAGCSSVDYGCVCNNKEFIAKIACCLEPVCDDAGKEATLKFAATICKGFGADLPTEVKCTTASGSDSGSSTAAPSSTGSGAASESTGSAAGSQTTSADSSATTGGGASGSGSSAAADSTGKPNAAPTHAAGLVGAAAALAFVL